MTNMTDTSWAAQTERDLQQRWVDRNILKLHKGPKTTTWDEVKAQARPMRAIWEPH